MTCKNLLKRYFRIREIIRQKGLPVAAEASLHIALQEVRKALLDAPCASRIDLNAKLRLVHDMSDDWLICPTITAAAARQVGEQVIIVEVAA